ncbi:DUF2510 domain-containing protein [Streptomyces sp. TRM66268-LWL]|uniref:DUF2510 domain-containing protein n=1 Tax=Streptomyces polyasparticus TaxID=2767826 RepID=A0ABR7SKG4_9ACTN|nr:DUF2510 domain-containing protein [Streptomyces polyasparticus]MBC9715517.1 DUF2510 domain-containing protein [Streptomyces polyasparticus]
MSMPPTPPGWYQDPEAPSHERWWDGTAWTPHTRVAQAPAVGHGLAPAGPAQHSGQYPGQHSGQYPAQHSGQFGPPAPVASGGPGGHAKVVALAAAGVVLVASIVTGVVVLGKDDKSDPGASTRTSPTAEATAPDDKPEPTVTASPESDAKVLEDQLNGITMPIPEGWERPKNTVEKAVTMTTEGTYPCPGDAGFCYHGRVTSRTVASGAGSDPEVAAKTDITEAADSSYDRDVIDRRPYNGITSHTELKSEEVVVAGSTGYLVRWRVKTGAGNGGYVQSVVFPKPGTDTLIAVRFAFDADDGPPLSLMDEITKSIRRIGDKGATDGGVGSSIAP